MTDTKTRPTFLGIDIEGDISRSDRKEQRPLEEFQPIVKAVLDDPTVVEFGWRQYTPYFNDGDPCIFGAHGAWVRLTTDSEAPGEDEDYDDEELEIAYGSKDRIGERPCHWEGQWPDRHPVYGAYTGPDEARFDRLMELHRAVDDGHFDDVLLDLFGDHA
ncbi:MAG TPA: hypothetical protein VF484_00875, partial [Candidatus Limnocylindrales bacterium]